MHINTHLFERLQTSIKRYRQGIVTSTGTKPCDGTNTFGAKALIAYPASILIGYPCRLGMRNTRPEHAEHESRQCILQSGPSSLAIAVYIRTFAA